MIEAEQLVKQYDKFLAVKGISLRVEQGELLALLGPNGAGKTTTIRMISSILTPTSGRAQVNGYDIITQSDMVRRSIGMLTEQPGLYERMSGYEYLRFYGNLYGLDDAFIRRKGVELFDRFHMPEAIDRRLGSYSKGMKQKAGLIRAMLHNPAVLLLDEPTSAMDPHSAKLVRDAIMELRQDRRSIVLCTHNLTEAEQLADRIAIVSHGRVVAEGTMEELKKQLLGEPLMEMTLDKAVNGELTEVAKLVQVELNSGNMIRYRTPNPAVTNPQLVRYLTGVGLGVISLTPVNQSLEDVYLTVVAGSTPAGTA